MKFVCGECQAKYQIPDERVAGRKLKIRCRKCGAAIHLRGDQVSAVDEPSPEVEWHVAVDGQQHGPYPTEQMGTMLRDGDLGWDASVWRDGYADWRDADASDTLVRTVASLAETRNSSTSMPPGVRASSPSIVPDFDDEEPTRMVQGGQPDEELPTRMVQHAAAPATRQRSVSPTSGISTAARPASVVPSAGIAPVQARSVSVAPAAAIAPLRAPAPAASLAAPPMPVHAEEFSYAATNLSAAPAPAPVRPGYAGGDGSGLIDIRALAALTQSGSSRPAEMQSARARATTPADVMVPLAAPISPFGNIDSLRPFERPQRNNSKALPIAIVVGSSVIAAAAFLAVFLTRREAAATAAVDMTAAPLVAAAAVLPTSPSAIAASPQAAEPAAAEPSEALAAVVQAPAPSAEQPADDEAEGEDDSPPPGAVTATRSGGDAKAKAKAVSKPGKIGGVAAKAKAASDAEDEEDDLLAAPAEGPAPEKPSIDDLLVGNDKAAGPAAAESKPKAAPAASRSIDDLLDDAVEKKGGGAAASASASNLAESPGRDEVKSAMQGIESEVKACAAGQTLDVPTATVAVTVTGSSGRVQSVRVTGNQGVVGSCIARVVRGAKFSPFSKPQFTFNFPYKLQ